MSCMYKVGTTVVYHNPSQLTDTVFASLASGASTGYDTQGTAISANTAASSVMLGRSRNVGMTYFSKALSNMRDVSECMIGAILQEFSGLTVAQRITELGKLSTVIQHIQIGSFATASSLLGSVTADTYISADFIARFQAMMTESDATTF